MTSLRYNERRRYSAAQIRMIQLVVGSEATGAWDEGCVECVTRWQQAKSLSADGKVGPATYAEVLAAALAEDKLPAITKVGAWAGRQAMAAPAAAVDFCQRHGIDRLDVVVNDHSHARAPRDFDLLNRQRITALCEAARLADIEVHLMSWVMPHATYIRQAGELLLPLLAETGARSLQWDAEEPWTKAEAPMPYPEAAALIAEVFAERECQMGVNGIGFTPSESFGPLAEVCDYLVPQCYATATNGSRPDQIVSTCVSRWRKEFPSEKPLAIGLAAFRQEGIEGFSPQQAMQASLLDVRAHGFDTVIYWSLRQLIESEDAQTVVSNIRPHAPPHCARIS
ncbi:peptidoglycan-binding protein [Pseudenhygromyxa sp. WMMC2535]|uniref:peptidoglycan-binding protein n=1 Tax=Pseudenhygromyxa sp. WMMC2535 TaxID=2712867 RepID=UPI0015522E5B|nr:peptidoglycan-binding protein [Pseudenhygromyxa sp. WMMC2535]NVB42690.1 peptidoglycan-binding protein [Pseudenhygromyxa sp. WMMC2535]